MSTLSVIDGIGFGAAGLVLATFYMRSMSALRWMAIASNVAFITYGYFGGLVPVLLLHVLLLPLNICRLAQRRDADIRSDPSAEPADLCSAVSRTVPRRQLSLLGYKGSPAVCRMEGPSTRSAST